MVEAFYLPSLRKSYNFNRLSQFLEIFNLKRLLLDGSAHMIMQLRRSPSFIAFMDAYVGASEDSESDTSLKFLVGEVAKQSKFDWKAFGGKLNPLIAEPSDFELLELEDGLGEVSRAIEASFGLSSRGEVKKSFAVSKRQKPIQVNTMAEIVFFVALSEELKVLTKSLSFARNASAPAASGKIGSTAFDILCPSDMGRVPAAVEVATYLEGRRNNRPKLIIVLGLAGGFQAAGTKPGHTICAASVVDLANRKVVDGPDGATQTKFRRRDFKLHHALRDLLQSDQFDEKSWQDEALEKADWPADRRPSLHDGLLACVDEVIASEDTQKKLLANTDKLLGVEMEAGGVCAAAERFSVPVSMLRVVSDNADPAKADDHWRKTGMKTMALLLQRFPWEQLLELLRR